VQLLSRKAPVYRYYAADERYTRERAAVFQSFWLTTKPPGSRREPHLTANTPLLLAWWPRARTRCAPETAPGSGLRLRQGSCPRCIVGANTPVVLAKTSAAVAVLVMALLSACQTQAVAPREDNLAVAGFIVKPANTAELKAMLNRLPTASSSARMARWCTPSTRIRWYADVCVLAPSNSTTSTCVTGRPRIWSTRSRWPRRCTRIQTGTGVRGAHGVRNTASSATAGDSRQPGGRFAAPPGGVRNRLWRVLTVQPGRNLASFPSVLR